MATIVNPSQHRVFINGVEAQYVQVVEAEPDDTTAWPIEIDTAAGIAIVTRRAKSIFVTMPVIIPDNLPIYARFVKDGEE